MSTFDDKQVLDALSAPLGDLISSVGTGVAEAQRALDTSALQTLQDLYANSDNHLLQSIGYRPTWYQIPEVEASISVALTLSGSVEQRGAGPRTAGRVAMYAAPVDGSYSQRFGFDVEASSTLRFKVVPVPPSTTAEAQRAVPPLVGRTLREALTLLRTLGIDYERPDPADLDATIIGQEPSAGSILAPEEVVTLEQALTPDVVGLTLAEARTRLAGETLDLVADADTHDYCIIVAQSPAAYTAVDGPNVTVQVLRAPDVVGLSRSDAVAAIEALSLILDTAPPEATRLITGQSPAAGTLLDPGSPVSIRSETPDVVGGPIATARATLGALHILARVPPGTAETTWVDGQQPAAGDPLDVGQLVELTPVLVPDVRSLEAAAARTRLAAGGLTGTPDVPDLPDAIVADQSPAPGAPVPADQTVALILKRAPDLVGLSFGQASDRATHDGLTVDDGDHPSTAIVASQAPAAGEPVRAGAPVVLEPVRLPDLVDIALEDAILVLKKLDARADWPEKAHLAVRVTTMAPAAGTAATPGLEVRLEPYRVPALVGTPADEAEKLLERQGFPHRGFGAEGEVHVQVPEARTVLLVDETVVVEIS